MTEGMITVRVGQLRPSPLNPRKTVDEAALLQLVESIRTDGLLQNLTVRGLAGEPDAFELVAGERRLRAIGTLIATGAPGWSFDTEITVQRRDVDDTTLLRLATAENVQRQDLHPLDEGDAYAELCRRGETPATIAAAVGLTERHVQERLRIVRDLAPEAIERFRAGTLSLAQARTLSRGSAEAQAKLLPVINHTGWGALRTADDIARELTRDLPSVRRAIFDVASSGLEVLDLASEEDDDYGDDAYEEETEGDEVASSAPAAPARQPTAVFRDPIAFAQRQRAAIEERRAQLAETWAWVQVVETATYWTAHGLEQLYGAALEQAKEEGRAGAVIVVYLGDLRVEIHEGFAQVRRAGPQPKSTVRSGDGPPPDPVAALSQGQLHQAARAKTEALQDAIAGLPTVAMRLACIAMLCNRGHLYGNSAVDLTAIMVEGHVSEDRRCVSPGVRGVLEGFAAALAGDELQAPTDADPWLQAVLRYGDGDTPERLWSALFAMPDQRVADLFAALVASRVALPLDRGGTLRLGDPPLAVTLASELGIRMDRRGVLTAAYVASLKREQLLALAAAIHLPNPFDPAAIVGAACDSGQGVKIAKAKAGELRAGIVAHAEATVSLHVPPELDFGGRLLLEARVRGAAEPEPKAAPAWPAKAKPAAKGKKATSPGPVARGKTTGGRKGATAKARAAQATRAAQGEPGETVY